MKFQTLTNGRVLVTYQTVTYQSPILVDENQPEFVTYLCAVTKQKIGRVYKTDGHWWLASCYWIHWTPVEVFSKIEGFFLLQTLHKQNKW